MTDKCPVKPSRSVLLTALYSFHFSAFTLGESRFSNSKHSHFYWTKKHFISEWFFTKNRETGNLVVRKVKKSWDSRQNRELRPAWESRSNCSSFRHVSIAQWLYKSNHATGGFISGASGRVSRNTVESAATRYYEGRVLSKGTQLSVNY